MHMSTYSRPQPAIYRGNQFIMYLTEKIKGAFFWDYSGIGILGIDGICVLLGAIKLSE